jgi:hypothetical protein
MWEWFTKDGVLKENYIQVVECGTTKKHYDIICFYATCRMQLKNVTCNYFLVAHDTCS